jgi:hypothetical protein
MEVCVKLPKQSIYAFRLQVHGLQAPFALLNKSEAATTFTVCEAPVVVNVNVVATPDLIEYLFQHALPVSLYELTVI